MKSCLNWTLDKMKSCTYINWTLDKMKSCTYINWTLDKMKSCTYINWILDKMKSCIYINWTLDKMKSCTYINWTLNNVVLIFVNLTCINQTPVYSEHKADSIIIHCTWHKQVCLDYTRYLSINYYIIVLDMMKTAIIIQLEQLGQYELFPLIGRLWSGQYRCSGISLDFPYTSKIKQRRPVMSLTVVW